VADAAVAGFLSEHSYAAERLEPSRRFMAELEPYVDGPPRIADTAMVSGRRRQRDASQGRTLLIPISGTRGHPGAWPEH
jgi:hypothetical protein